MKDIDITGDISLHAEQFLKKLSVLGLIMNSKSGGGQYSGLEKKIISKTAFGYHLPLSGNESISFVEGQLFMQTVRLTESNTNVHLFQNS